MQVEKAGKIGGSTEGGKKGGFLFKPPKGALFRLSSPPLSGLGIQSGKGVVVMALQDESLEYIRQQYDEKNMLLSQFGEQVSPYTFYEDVFGNMELELPVTVIGAETGKKIQTMQLQDAIEFSSCRNDVLLSGCSYFNNWVSKKSTRDIYAFVVDFDNAYSGILQNALRNDWRNDNGVQYAKPTYIVNSGTGLHLYFVFDRPVPCYHVQIPALDTLYRRLARQQILRHYAGDQVQWFGQGFRMAGGMGKNGWENTVFRYGEKWDIDQMAAFYGMKETHFIREPIEPGEPVPRKKKQDHPSSGKQNKKKGFRTNRAFYDYTLVNCRQKTKEGNRYMSMCALTVIAYKCGVPLDEVERDLFDLLPVYNQDCIRKVLNTEVYSALKMYNERAMQTQRDSLERWIGWEYKPIKRNGRNREMHLRLARASKAVLKEFGGLKNPEGRPSSKHIVRDYQAAYPAASKADCHRATGLDPKTIRKWWNC